MKSLVSSHQADNRLSENFLSFRERDKLFEQLHASLEFISRTSGKTFQQLPIKIDSLQIVLDLEIDSTTILIREVHGFDECF
jgi:hypothetical protein